jgi:DNA polymerase I
MHVTREVRIIDTSYEDEDGEAVLRLFGKTSKSESIVIKHYGYKPYMYVVDLASDDMEKLAEDKNVVDIKTVDLTVGNKLVHCSKITLAHPSLMAKYRNSFKSKNYQLLATDIPFADRFLYDFNLGACVKVSGTPIEEPDGYPVDIVLRAEKYGKCKSFKPELKVLSLDVETSVKTGAIYTICLALKSGAEIQTAKLVGAERDIITEFIAKVKSWDPDVITGYNIEGFDFPVIQERAGKYKLKLDLGRDGSLLRGSPGTRQWRIHGRLCVDVWLMAKRELSPRKESLEYLAELLLGEHKLPVDPLKLDELWQTGQAQVLEYCLTDAMLALKILERLGTLDKLMDLATVSALPMDEVLANRPSVLIDSLLIREAQRRNLGIPDMKKGKEREEMISVTGGYVHSIEPGLYSWVCVLDFKSMYPSVIMSKNICFTTLSDEGKIVSPIGVKFVDASMKRGVLPALLEQLMRDREDARRKMRTAKSPDKVRYYDGLQQAIKTLMNSFYGVFASAFYRFTNPQIGGSITAFSRGIIQNVISTLTREGINVIYADTDSIFFQSPYTELDKTLEFGQKIAKRFSTSEGITLEFEKVLETFFSHGKKKRYVGKVVWPVEDTLVRGYEIRRRDAFELQTEALTGVFNKILSKDIEGAQKLARNLVRSVQHGDVAPNKLAVSKTVREEEEYEAPERMAGIQAAKKLKSLGYEFVPGMKVSWIVTDSKRSPQVVEPYIEGKAFEHKPDYQYYAERLAASLARVTEVFGMDENALLTGVVQKTLF